MHFGISIASKSSSYMVRCSAIELLLKTIDIYPPGKKKAVLRRLRTDNRRQSTTTGTKVKKYLSNTIANTLKGA